MYISRKSKLKKLLQKYNALKNKKHNCTDNTIIDHSPVWKPPVIEEYKKSIEQKTSISMKHLTEREVFQ